MDPFNRNPHSNVVHTHHHHRRNSDEDEPQQYPPPGNNFSSFNNPQYPPPPQPQQPPFYADSYPPPPRQQQPETQVFHSGHVSSDFNYSAPPPPSHHHHNQPDHVNLNYGYPPAPTPTPPVPDYSTVHHVSHESHLPRFSNPSENVVHVSHQSHHGHPANPSAPPLSNVNKRTFRVITKADPNYALTIRRGEVVLARSDPSDQYQHWYKDEKFSTKVKDSEGYPAFSLVNKVTGEAIKHSIGASHPVRLIRYNPDYLDESILWTESRDLGDGYRTIRMVNNVKLNMDAFHGDKLSGGVHDGTTIVLWDWNKGDNQSWKILPY